MPKPTIADVLRQIEELRALVKAADSLALGVALRLDKEVERLDRHVASSGDVHRELRGRLSVLEEHVHDIRRRSP